MACLHAHAPSMSPCRQWVSGDDLVHMAFRFYRPVVGRLSPRLSGWPTRHALPWSVSNAIFGCHELVSSSLLRGRDIRPQMARYWAQRAPQTVWSWHRVVARSGTTAAHLPVVRFQCSLLLPCACGIESVSRARYAAAGWSILSPKSAKNGGRGVEWWRVRSTPMHMHMSISMSIRICACACTCTCTCTCTCPCPCTCTGVARRGHVD